MYLNYNIDKDDNIINFFSLDKSKLIKVFYQKIYQQTQNIAYSKIINKFIKREVCYDNIVIKRCLKKRQYRYLIIYFDNELKS